MEEKMRLAALVPLLALFACKDGGNETDDEGPDVGDVDGEPSTDVGGDYGLEGSEDCEEADLEDGPVALPGATSYWVGEFVIDGVEVEGFEANVLFANTMWVEEEPSTHDCQVVYSVSGEIVDDPSCTACDHQLALMATLDEGASSCIPAFMDYVAPSYQVVYDVQVDGEGNATFYFDSGNVLGVGEWGGSGAWYATDKSCEWY